ncbi:hypothetical protein ANANG_G00144140 [Anguilla anguilla]|uniref:Uncharacterized protein n=1 Tax=Anguilla anguilla TaxID=7936 RepID=A0A9D3MEP5_ANGAN|nr:hypothetical protein ANANG_G00144140 [Anguilla anguilla]
MRTAFCSGRGHRLGTLQPKRRSAVDQLCQPDSGRPRMSVEEQLERIRRHQQASLREKKKGLNVLGGQENSPSRTPSFSKENPFRTPQSRKREEVLSSDIQELEASLREQDLVKEQETPAEEIARLKEGALQESFNMERELSKPNKVVIPERYVEMEPEEALSPEEEADKQKKVDRIKALIAKNSMQNVVPAVTLSPEGDAEEEGTVQEQEKIINISYELAAEASKRSKLNGDVAEPRPLFAIPVPLQFCFSPAPCPAPLCHCSVSPRPPHLRRHPHSSQTDLTSCVCSGQTQALASVKTYT